MILFYSRTDLFENKLSNGTHISDKKDTFSVLTNVMQMEIAAYILQERWKGKGMINMNVLCP